MFDFLSVFTAGEVAVWPSHLDLRPGVSALACLFSGALAFVAGLVLLGTDSKHISAIRLDVRVAPRSRTAEMRMHRALPAPGLSKHEHLHGQEQRLGRRQHSQDELTLPRELEAETARARRELLREHRVFADCLLFSVVPAFVLLLLTTLFFAGQRAVDRGIKNALEKSIARPASTLREKRLNARAACLRVAIRTAIRVNDFREDLLLKMQVRVTEMRETVETGGWSALGRSAAQSAIRTAQGSVRSVRHAFLRPTRKSRRRRLSRPDARGPWPHFAGEINRKFLAKMVL